MRAPVVEPITLVQSERDYLIADISRDDLWVFLQAFVKTFDEHDPTVRSKPFPRKAIYRLLCRMWVEFDVAHIKKARQIMATWFACGAIVHDSIHKYNRRIFDQSKGQRDANHLIKRQSFIYEQLAACQYPYLPNVKMTGDKIGTTNRLEFPAMGSVIEAIPEGPDILRSYVSSVIFADEINHQPKAEDGFAGAAPTISGGGKWWGQGTANGHSFSWCKRHNFDPITLEVLGENKADSREIDVPNIGPRFTGDLNNPGHVEAHRRAVDDFLLSLPDDEFSSIPLIELCAYYPGVDYWINCGGDHCVWIDHEADPDKSSKTEKGREWIAREKARVGKTRFKREYKGDEDTFMGRPVVSDWDEEVFVKELDYDSEVPLDLSFDFGTQTCGAFFSQYVYLPEFRSYKLRIIDELWLHDSETNELALEVKRRMERFYSRSWVNRNFYIFCDPNGDQRSHTTSDKSLNTNIKILKHHLQGVVPKNRLFGNKESTELMETVFSQRLPDGSPVVEINRKCKYARIVCQCLHYPQKGGTEGHYEKDGIYDHGGDALRYEIANRFQASHLTPLQTRPREVLVPFYAPFTGQRLGWKKVRIRARV